VPRALHSVLMTSPACPAAATGEGGSREIDADIYVKFRETNHSHGRFFPALLDLFDRPEVEVSTLSVCCPPEEFTNPTLSK